MENVKVPFCDPIKVKLTKPAREALVAHITRLTSEPLETSETVYTLAWSFGGTYKDSSLGQTKKTPPGVRFGAYLEKNVPRERVAVIDGHKVIFALLKDATDFDKELLINFENGEFSVQQTE